MLRNYPDERERAIEDARDYYRRELLGGPVIYDKAIIRYNTRHIALQSNGLNILFLDSESNSNGDEEKE